MMLSLTEIAELKFLLLIQYPVQITVLRRLLNKDECVDETPSNEDTDYIYSDTLNHKQGFGITTGSLSTVKGIQLNNHCRLDQAGTRKITPLIRSNSTDYSGTETGAIPADYRFESEIFETDPDDSSAWTQTKLEAAEFGLEITT
jgi:hypothetical protein